MRCSNCQRENDPDNRFCIFCGTPLPASEAQELPEAVEDSPVDDTSLDIADSSQENVPGHQAEPEMNYVGLKKRLVAWIIDAVILLPLFFLPGYLYVEINDIKSFFRICIIIVLPEPDISSVFIYGSNFVNMVFPEGLKRFEWKDLFMRL